MSLPRMSRKIAFLWPTPICLKINALTRKFHIHTHYYMWIHRRKTMLIFKEYTFNLFNTVCTNKIKFFYAPNLLSIVSSMFFVSEVTFLSVLLPRNVCTVSLVRVSNLGFYKEKKLNIIFIRYYVILLIWIWIVTQTNKIRVIRP